MSATRCGTSVDDCEDAMVEILRDGETVKRNAMRPGLQYRICADTSQSSRHRDLVSPPKNIEHRAWEEGAMQARGEVG